MMTTLTRAHKELFRRRPDESFESFNDLWDHCRNEKEASRTLWHPPNDVRPVALNGQLELYLSDGQPLRPNDWSFGQLCHLADVGKATVNRLSPETAERVLAETLPGGDKPLQVYAVNDDVRSIHRASYTRLYNADLLEAVVEFSPGFQAPQEASGGGTGLYCGEQDMFCFLVDPLGWTEVNGEAFAPGFFLWNSEVGRRSVGIQTFWFQAVCQNHIVWDAIEVTEYSRKHTTNVGEALGDIGRLVEQLAERRDERRDGFAALIKKAMETQIGEEADKVRETLRDHGVARWLAEEALKQAQQHGGLTVFSVVDALTRLSRQLPFAADRAEADSKASRLLELAT